MLIPLDPAEHIETPTDIIEYLKAAMEGNDPKHIASALGDVQRAIPGIIKALEE